MQPHRNHTFLPVSTRSCCYDLTISHITLIKNCCFTIRLDFLTFPPIVSDSDNHSFRKQSPQTRIVGYRNITVTLNFHSQGHSCYQLQPIMLKLRRFALIQVNIGIISTLWNNLHMTVQPMLGSINLLLISMAGCIYNLDQPK